MEDNTSISSNRYLLYVDFMLYLSFVALNLNFKWSFFTFFFVILSLICFILTYSNKLLLLHVHLSLYIFSRININQQIALHNHLWCSDNFKNISSIHPSPP